MTDENYQYYNDLAPDYDSISLEKGKYDVWKEFGEVLHSALKRPSRILDIGCGTGLTGMRALEEGHEVVGLDFSENMLKIAEGRGYTETVLGDFNDTFPFPDASFDAVITAGATEFCKDYGALLAETQRVLKPQGILLATFPDARSDAEWFEFTNTNQATLKRMLEEAGLTAEQLWERFGYEKFVERLERIDYFCVLARKH